MVILRPSCVARAQHWQHSLVSCRCVSMWSPLAAAFNTKPVSRPLYLNLKRKKVGLFGIPELKDASGFYDLKQDVASETERLVAESVSPNRSRKLVQVFDQLSDTLCRLADMADFVRVAHPDHSFAQAAEDACMSTSALVERLNTNVPIYKALKEVVTNGDKFSTDEVDKRVAELFLFDFEQSGIHLEENARKKFVELNESILMLGNSFMQNAQRHVAVPRASLPEHVRNCFSYDGDNVFVTGLFTEHFSDLVREAAYKIYLYPNPEQERVLESLLAARHQLAQLVGFPTYAHRALNETLGASPENVTDFLETLAQGIRKRADEDFEEIKMLKSHFGQTKQGVMPWDPSYYSNLARNQRCKVASSEVAPYFSLGGCMEGLSQLFSSLFGVTLQHQDCQYGELWSEGGVSKLAVTHETEGTLGYIYCDFFERSGKPHQDCHFTIRGGRLKEDGEYQLPVVVLMLNLPHPQGRTPTLLSLGQLENLFHEFGHAMHSMLGRTRYQHVTGTRCPTDFAEVPSVLMEYFVSDRRVLSMFARHYETGKKLPEDMLDKICRAKTMFSASEMQLQVFYSLLDQIYHGQHPLEKSTMDIIADVQNKYYSIPYVPGTAWQLRFSHFVGYGAKYYSYLMSRAVASQIWHKCFKDDPFSRTMGEQYRSKVLAHGGSYPPADLVKGLLNEKPTASNMVQALLDDI